MLYLVTPTQQVLWLRLPADVVLNAATQHDVDLAHLEWAPADLPYSNDLLKLALAHGTPAANGIVLDGALVARTTEATRLRDSLEQLHDADAKTGPTDAFMERLLPGRQAHRDELNQRIDARAEEQIAEANEQARALIDTPPQRILTEHWAGLGGALPRHD